ncbi:PLD nuclease N-terminal domain-containing protein [Nocardioides sp.]|uniref:PLD nuclease N-terminal domain-containing protein n=1 Tax=Nocardioides sp. TaxID=35761 RepID=UPI0027357D67|nr:PLD nuclease N-terminal domain-containing protein [Nocardioides sp.]MDP3894252.1 PLD nuclease N-terminal domain-containing protein [Nocardioides sp.]
MARLVLFYVVPLVLGIYCLVSAIISRDDEVRHLPKIAWILLILFFPFVGSIAWLAAGRPVTRPRAPSPYERATPEFPEYDRPGRAAAVDPDADAEFLRRIRERAEEQRRRAREQKLPEPEPEPEGDSG